MDVESQPDQIPARSAPAEHEPASEAYASARSLIDERERLWRATHGLRMVAPHLSAHDGPTRRQRRVIMAVLLFFVLAFVFDRRHTGIAIIGFMTIVYTAVIALRLLLIVKSLDKGEEKSDLARLRRDILDAHVQGGSYRLIVARDPERDRETSDYSPAVDDWMVAHGLPRFTRPA